MFLQRSGDDLQPVTTRQLLEWYDETTQRHLREQRDRDTAGYGYVEPGLFGLGGAGSAPVPVTPPTPRTAVEAYSVRGRLGGGR